MPGFSSGAHFNSQPAPFTRGGMPFTGEAVPFNQVGCKESSRSVELRSCHERSQLIELAPTFQGAARDRNAAHLRGCLHVNEAVSSASGVEGRIDSVNLGTEGVYVVRPETLQPYQIVVRKTSGMSGVNEKNQKFDTRQTVGWSSSFVWK